MASSDRAGGWSGAWALVGCAIFGAPLLAHAYAGTAGRYLGDDYCAGYIFRDYGLVGGQIWHYKSWSAVPTTLMLMAATEPGGARLAPVLPAAALVLWLLAGSWTIRTISRVAGVSWSWPVCVCLAEALMFATLQDAPNVAQSLYLRVPMLAYTCPLIVMTVYIGWLVRAVDRNSASPWASLSSAAFACAFGAFGPVCAAFLVAALVVTWGLSRVLRPDSHRRAVDRLLATGFTGALIALALVVFAPGNAVRQALFPQPPSLIKVGIWSVLYSAFMFFRPIVPFVKDLIIAVAPRVIGGTPRWLPTAIEMGTSPIPMAIAIALPAGLALFSEPAGGGPLMKRGLWGIPVLAFVLVCACVAPGAYGTSAPPPPRALIIPQYVMTCLAACWGFLLGAVVLAPRRGWLTSRPAVLWIVAACLCIFGPLAATPPIVATGTAMRQWARAWDDTDRKLREAQAGGVSDAVVPALEKLAGVGSISPDPQDWVNICAAKYYGLRSITGRPTLQ
jgi:hypothetical protein